MMEEILFPGPLSVRAAFNWINQWARNWPSGATLTADQAQMADHFVRGLDPYESAAAIAEGRTL